MNYRAVFLGTTVSYGGAGVPWAPAQRQVPWQGQGSESSPVPSCPCASHCVTARDRAALTPQRTPPPSKIPRSSRCLIRYNGNVPEVLVILIVILVITRTLKINLILLLSVMILYENMWAGKYYRLKNVNFCIHLQCYFYSNDITELPTSFHTLFQLTPCIFLLFYWLIKDYCVTFDSVYFHCLLIMILFWHIDRV